MYARGFCTTSLTSNSGITYGLDHSQKRLDSGSPGGSHGHPDDLLDVRERSQPFLDLAVHRGMFTC